MRKFIPIRQDFDRFREPTLAEMLSDPIVKAVMRADCVDPERLADMLSWISDELQADDPPSFRNRGDFKEQQGAVLDAGLRNDRAVHDVATC